MSRSRSPDNTSFNTDLPNFIEDDATSSHKSIKGKRKSSDKKYENKHSKKNSEKKHSRKKHKTTKADRTNPNELLSLANASSNSNNQISSQLQTSNNSSSNANNQSTSPSQNPPNSNSNKNIQTPTHSQTFSSSNPNTGNQAPIHLQRSSNSNTNNNQASNQQRIPTNAASHSNWQPNISQSTHNPTFNTFQTQATPVQPNSLLESSHSISSQIPAMTTLYKPSNQSSSSNPTTSTTDECLNYFFTKISTIYRNDPNSDQQQYISALGWLFTFLADQPYGYSKENRFLPEDKPIEKSFLDSLESIKPKYFVSYITLLLKKLSPQSQTNFYCKLHYLIHTVGLNNFFPKKITASATEPPTSTTDRFISEEEKDFLADLSSGDLSETVLERHYLRLTQPRLNLQDLLKAAKSASPVILWSSNTVIINHAIIWVLRKFASELWMESNLRDDNVFILSSFKIPELEQIYFYSTSSQWRRKAIFEELNAAAIQIKFKNQLQELQQNHIKCLQDAIHKASTPATASSGSALAAAASSTTILASTSSTSALAQLSICNTSNSSLAAAINTQTTKIHDSPQLNQKF